MGLPSLEIEKKETGVLGDVVVITTGRKKRAKDIVFQMRRQIVDAATVCTMAMCLSEDGYILQYILDFYIMAAVIFAVHSQIEDLTWSSITSININSWYLNMRVEYWLTIIYKGSCPGLLYQ